jgi:hypothetical protein
MSQRRARILFCAAVTSSLLAGLAVAGSTGATSPDRVGDKAADTLSLSPVDSAGVSSGEPGAIEWTQIRPGSEEGYLDVPIDYANPDDGELRL